MSDVTSKTNQPDPVGGTKPTVRPCPRCQTPVDWSVASHKPFCGRQCQLIDLGAWASDAYALPSDEAPFLDDQRSH